jgi:hypothetical protein
MDSRLAQLLGPGVLTMLLRWYLLFALLSIRCVGQAPDISRADFEVPGGIIFGAALSHDGSVFYAQQYLSDDSIGGDNQHLVKLSSWNISGKVMLASKTFSEAQHTQTMPCRRTLLGATSGHLYVCSDRAYIRILDGRALTTLRTVQTYSEGAIRDFAIDESRDRLYLLAEHVNGASTLEELTISTGARINEVTLTEPMLAYSPLAYRSEGSLLVVAFARTGGFAEKTDLVFYDGSTLEVVKRVSDLPRIDGLVFFGSKLLAAPGYAGYKKQKCILSVDLQTFKSDKNFCSPNTGVHSSVAIVNNIYLVAATGINRPKLFSDTPIESVSSSLSVWSVETRKLLTTLPLPPDFTSWLSGVTILGSSGGCFVAYQSAGGSPVVISACIADQRGESNRIPLSRIRPK